MDEFSLIDALLAEEAPLPDWVRIGPGDDAAVVAAPAGTEWVLSTDSLVEGRHFPAGLAPDVLAWRALAVNLSDLAAMGATPGGFLVALVAPALTAEWCRRFSAGLRVAAGDSGARLIGGNLARGPLTVTVTVTGTVAAGRSLLRSMAAPGDRICVSGVLGAALAAREHYEREAPSLAGLDIAGLPDAWRPYLLPVARLGLGQHLVGQATACIDVSDGLLADLGHLCAASGVAADVALAALPVEGRDPLAAATGGDDYELVFTLPPGVPLAPIVAATGVPVTVIGQVRSGSGVRLLDADGSERVTEQRGWSHFG